MSLVTGSLGEPPACPVDGTLAEARFTTIAAMTADANGRLYVAENAPGCINAAHPLGSSRVRVVDLEAGTVTTRSTFANRDRQGAWPTPWTGIAVGSDGRTVVTAPPPSFVITGPNPYGGLYVVAPDGSQQEFKDQGSDSVALSSNGTIYLSGRSFSTFGAQAPVALFESPSNAYPVASRVIAFGPSDALYLSNGSVIHKRSGPASAALWVGGNRAQSSNGSSISDGTGTRAGFDGISAMAVDAAGQMYVVDGGHTVRHISPDGVVTTIAGQAGVHITVDLGPLPGKLASANAIAVTRDGRVFVNARGAILQVGRE